MESPTYLSYVYYYSTKAKKAVGRRAKGIEEKKINDALIDFYDRRLAISVALSKWCIDEIQAVGDEEQQYQETVIQSLEDVERQIEQKLECLTFASTKKR